MPHRSRWTWVWIALAAFVALRALGRPPHRGVLLDHLEFGRRLLHGEDVYGPWQPSPDAASKPLHAPYPPSFGLLTAPFALLDQWFGLRAARLAWVLLQIGALVALFRALRAMPNAPAPPTPQQQRWVMLLALALLSRLILRDMHGGGGNLINVAMCTLAFAHAERDQPRRAGWWLGLSLATKPTQGLLVLLLLAQGRMRVVLHTLTALVVCVLASLMLLRLDFGPWLRWLEGALAMAAQQDAFATPALQWPEFEWMNQSLRCALARWLTDVPSDLSARVAWGVTPGLSLAPAAASALNKLALAAMMLWLLVAGWQSRSATSPASAVARRAAQFAAALALSLLASPISWKAHHVALLPAFVLMLDRIVTERARLLAGFVLAWFVCCGIGQQIVGDDGDEWLNSLYLVTFFDIAILVVVLRMRPAPEAIAT